MEDIQESVDKPRSDGDISPPAPARLTSNNHRGRRKRTANIFGPSQVNRTAASEFSSTTNAERSSTSAQLQWDEDAVPVSSTRSTAIDPALRGKSNNSVYSLTSPPALLSPLVETHGLLNRHSIAHSSPADLLGYQTTITNTTTDQYLLKYFIDNVAPWVRATLYVRWAEKKIAYSI